jgi:hypothetical protein
MICEDPNDLIFRGGVGEQATIEVLSNNTKHSVTYTLDAETEPHILTQGQVLTIDLTDPKREVDLLLHFANPDSQVGDYTVSVKTVTNTPDGTTFIQSYQQSFGVPVIAKIYTFLV